MSNWYIGQEIVAIKDHSQGMFKKNDVFVINNLRTSYCKCGHILIDIGIFAIVSPTNYCTTCDTLSNTTSKIYWFNEVCFAPLDSFVNHEELNEIKEQILQL